MSNFAGNPAYVVWDVETTVKSSFKRKANPFDKDNFIVMSGWCRANNVVGDYFGAGPRPKNYFTKLLQGTKLLVGFNIKFDILHALNDPDAEIAKLNRKAWKRFVVGGGNVWDAQLAEYLLRGMVRSSHMLALDEVAPDYGGNTKYDEVKALWEAGIDTLDIDHDLLRKYLCGFGDHDGDIGNTEKIFLGQYEAAKASGQLKSILLNMGSLLCTIEMEHNGMHVDIERGRELAKTLEQRIAESALKIAEYIPKDFPADFKWSSNAHKSAIIFGGDVPYEKWVQHKDEDGNLLYAMKDELHYLLDDGSSVRVEDCQVVPANAVRFKSGKNAGEPKTKKVKVQDLSKPKGKQTRFYYHFDGYATPNPEWATSNEGQYQTGAEIIAELGETTDVPFLQDLSELTAMRKDLSTYYITVDPKKGEVGMLTLVQADGIIHHVLNHTSTVTARLSSSGPNLQNIPTGAKSDVKTVFISRFKDGYIVQSDFTSLEVYTQAILTNCKQLIEDLRKGLDMHCVRVSQSEGVKYEDALVWCKDEHHENFPVWHVKRKKAKTFSFQRAYGAGASKIAKYIKSPVEFVEKLIAAEEERYPEIKHYYDRLTAELDRTAVDDRFIVMHPTIRGLHCNLKLGYKRTPDGKLYAWRMHPAPEFVANRPAHRGGMAANFAPTEVKNYPVQGLGGEWAKAAMWLAVRAFYASGFGDLALLVNQVHDAIYVDAETGCRIEAAALLEACMCEASTFMEYWFNWEIKVPVPTETVYGRNMMEEHGFDGDFKDRVMKARKYVRATFIRGYTPKHDTLKG